MYVCYTNGILPYLPKSVQVIEKIRQSWIFKFMKSMSKINHNRNRWLNVRLTEDEYLIIQKRFEKSTCLKLSEYSRHLLLKQTVRINYRNQSLDEMMEEFILLRQELNFVGHNFNQVVRKLNTYGDLPDAQIWKKLIAALKNDIEPCMLKIKGSIQNYAELWSQKSSVERA